MTDSIRIMVDNFVEGLRASLKDNLQAVILYGSAAKGEYIKKHSNVNLLIVLKKPDIRSLRDIAVIKKSGKFRSIVPLALSEDYIRNSTDTFPIEFLDIKEHYKVIYGEDCLKGLKIELVNLRHQCEWELKSKIIRMQQFYINAQGKDAALKSFLISSLPSFLVVFKNILRLKNIESNKKEEIIDKTAEAFELDRDIFHSISQARIGKNNIRNAREIFEKFLNELNRLSCKIDK